MSKDIAIDRIESQLVSETFSHCLYKEGELPQGGTPPPDAVRVEGIRANYGLHPERLEKTRDLVKQWAALLSDDFHEGKGGGHSFLNVCTDRNDDLWTGMHTIVEALCCLIIGLKLGKWCMPKETWSALPAGMPYIVIHKET